MIRLLLGVVFLLAGPVLAQENDRSPERLDDSSWSITGESLEGSREGETRLVSPRAEQGSTVILARRGLWRHSDDLLILTGNVVIEDSSRTLIADSATYDRATGLGILVGYVRGAGPEGELSSRELRFWRDQHRIELRDSAWVDDGERILRANRIDYDTRAQTGVATGEVVINEKADQTEISGGRADLDRRRNRVVVTGNPSLHRLSEEGGAAVDLWADTLDIRQTERVGYARGNVRLLRGGVVATAGKAVYDFDGDLLWLGQNPIARDPDGEVTGDSMAVVMRSGRAERLEVLGNTQLRYRPRAKPGEIDYVIGDTLIARIDSLGVREIHVLGNARSLYLPSPIDRTNDVGSNLSRGRSIRVYLEDGEAKRVDLEGSANGEYVLPRDLPDTTVARIDDSLYVARAIAFFLENPDQPLPDSLEQVGPFDPRERVSYEGSTVFFHVPERRIEIHKNGKVIYQNLELESEEIVFEAAQDRVVALGKPSLSDQESEIVGQRMVYRLDSKHGFVYQGKTEFEGGFYSGEAIKRVDRQVLLVQQGDYTTCDADTSHFHFHSNRMKIRLGDRVIARPIVLYLKNIPLMALPYWVFPIKRGRHSGVLMPDVEFGFDQDRGRFVRNVGYYYAPNDYMDAMLWGDYYERNPRWIVNSQIRYKARYRLGGELFSSYSGEETSSGRSKRWDMRGSHEQTLGERFTLKVRGNFVSDKDYRDDREFGGTVDERLNRILKSSVDLRKSWSRTSLSVTASRTENLDADSAQVLVDQSVPSIDFSVSSFPIGREADELGRGAFLPELSTIYTRFSSSFRTVYQKRRGVEERLRNSAANVRTGLSDNRTIGPYLKLTPSISLTAAWFYKDNLSLQHRPGGKKNQIGAVWSSGLSAGSTLYGTFPVGLGPLIALRHVIEPSVSYSYAPEFESLLTRDPTDTTGTEIRRFASVGGIGLSGSEVSSLSLSLTQRFHMKYRSDDPEKPNKKDNLILWTTSTSYDFRRQGKDPGPLSSIRNSLRFNPSRFFENSWSVSHDPDRRMTMTSLSARSSIRISGGGRAAASDTLGSGALEDYGGFGQADRSTGRPGERASAGTGPWSLALTHNFSRGENRSSESSTLNLSSSINPTTDWRLNWSIYYDLREKDTRSWSFSLYRDLHCWEMKFDRRVSGGNSQYYFRINVKALPDIQYEQERR